MSGPKWTLIGYFILVIFTNISTHLWRTFFKLQHSLPNPLQDHIYCSQTLLHNLLWLIHGFQSVLV